MLAPLDVRLLDESELARVTRVLSVARLHQGDGFYLVAWDGDEPAGHLHLALTDPPELQNVEVAEAHRRLGVAQALIAAAEREASARGFATMRVSTDTENDAAQGLYRQLGYRDVGIAPRRVCGTIEIRTGPIEVDEVLMTWEKQL